MREKVISFVQCAILSVLEGLSSSGRVPNVHLDVLISMKSHLKKILVGFVVLHFFLFSFQFQLTDFLGNSSPKLILSLCH